MKKRGISPEYIYESIPGSFNMHEQRSFFGSKMMYIDDGIFLDNQDIVYYQQPTGEQLDLTQEINLVPILYSTTQDKLDNLSFGFDITQSDTDKENKTKWVLEINLRRVLKNYIFANIKTNRTFELIKNKNTQPKSVSESINNYIDNNIINRYQYKNIDFFIKYKKLNENNINRFETNYNSNIESIDNKYSNIQTIFTEDKSMVRIFFTQQEDSKEYTFDYYLNIRFEKK